MSLRIVVAALVGALSSPALVAGPFGGALPTPVALQRFPATETYALRSPFRRVTVPYTADLLVRGSGRDLRVWLLVHSTEDGAALLDCATCDLTVSAGDAGPQVFRGCPAEPYTSGGLKFDDSRAVLHLLRSATVVHVAVPLAVAGDAPGVLGGVVRTFSFRIDGLQANGRSASDTCDRDFYGD